MPALKRSGLLKMKGKVVSFEEFERLIENLFSNGFYNTNGSLNQIADYMGYKAFLQIEEFMNDKGEKVSIEFIKEIINGTVHYYIKDIEVSQR